jgi:hypothetical protein
MIEEMSQVIFACGAASDWLKTSSPIFDRE